jgi:hypothetical protein
MPFTTAPKRMKQDKSKINTYRIYMPLNKWYWNKWMSMAGDGGEVGNKS